MKVIYEMVHPRGGVTHLEWMGRIDGKDYPLQGIDAFVTYAYDADLARCVRDRRQDGWARGGEVIGDRLS